MSERAHDRRIAKRRAAPPHLVIPPLPGKRYDIAYVDPPWYYYGSPVKDAAAGKHYPLMSLEELSAIDVRHMLNKRAAAFIWATCPRLNFALTLIDAWKLHYRGVAYIWVKVNRRGAIIRTMIERLCGQRSRIELFARSQAEGWDVWGAESSR